MVGWLVVDYHETLSIDIEMVDISRLQEPVSLNDIKNVSLYPSLCHLPHGNIQVSVCPSVRPSVHIGVSIGSGLEVQPLFLTTLVVIPVGSTTTGPRVHHHHQHFTVQATAQNILRAICRLPCLVTFVENDCCCRRHCPSRQST